ncbi:MAG: hypothetical protein K2X86_02635 [Cytophagaceae bacterium]|nr:hypothetical protein [Cytophagaceae bacterium]
MKTLDNKLIIYDSNCKVCSSLKEVVVKLTSIPENKISAYNNLPAEHVVKVDPNQFKNVMALIDTKDGNTIYGAEGIAYIFSSQYKIADLLLKVKPFYWLFEQFYKIQANNRYIIATPKNKSKFECDCYPDPVFKYRLSYIILTFLASTLLTMLLGISLRKFLPGLSVLEAAKQMLLIAGTGWVLQILAARIFMKEKFMDYLGHLGSIMVVGLLVFIPWWVFWFVTGIKLMYFPLASVLFSSGLMLYLHIERVRYLKLSAGWTVSWFLFLQSTALFWVYYYHFKS